MPESRESGQQELPRDITDLLRQRVLSGEQYGLIYFWQDYANLEDEGHPLSIRISASEIPAGRESGICNFFKAFLEKNPGKVSKSVIITGTKQEFDHLS